MALFLDFVCGKSDHKWDRLVLIDKVNMKKKKTAPFGGAESNGLGISSSASSQG